MNNKIINLHFYSEYSFFESPTKIKNYVEWAKENNLNSLVITDHNNVHGFADFRKYCFLYNIKPIFGIDLDVENVRFILLAKNNQGFQKIKLLAYNKSKNIEIKIEDILSDNLVIILNPNFAKQDIIEAYKNKIPNLYFYNKDLPISNIYVKDTRILNKSFYNSLKIINDLKEIKLDENQDYNINLEININEIQMQNIQKIINECNVTFQNSKDISLPALCEDPYNELKELIKKGLNNRKDIVNYDRNLVQSRIEYEMSVIKKMNIENYFLIISDLINWSKNNSIYIGPGRGSVSGSLIAYLIGITQINPLKYNLYFERFLNEERITLPDIDIDIQDDKREEVINYLKNKYGFDNVAQICTYQRIGSKQALKDCGRFLNISFSRMNEITKLISGSDPLQTSYDTNVKFKALIDSEEILTKLFQYSLLIESLPRQIGIHAAGVVIANKPIIDLIPIMDIDNNKVTQFSMEYIEEWGLLKIDLLGLRTLTIIKKIEENIKQIFDPNFDFEQIPLNDDKTNKLLTNAKVLGIFQLESPGMMATLKTVQINNFDDLVDVISLYRPGPLSNIQEYIKVKNDKSSFQSINQEYDEIISKTNGIIIYQEQIMEIIQKVAKLSFSKADILRRAISKKKKDDILEMEKLFLKGALKNNYKLDVAQKIYNEIVKFAEYGFNKSHAVAYATLSYRMAYMKARYPLCFYIGIISLTYSTDSINKIVMEAKELKFNINSPSINKISREIYHDKKNNMYLPLTFIKGLGEVANNKILNDFENNGKFQDFFDFIARMKTININNSIIDILIESNTLRDFGNMNTLINNKTKALSYASIASFKDTNTNEIMLDSKIKKPLLEVFPEDLELESKNEIKYLGMIFNAFVTSKFESRDKLINLKPGVEYKIALLVTKKKEITNTKFKSTSYFIEVCDSSGKEEIWFNSKYKHIFDEIKVNTIGYGTIIKSTRNNKIYTNLYEWKVIE